MRVQKFLFIILLLTIFSLPLISFATTGTTTGTTTGLVPCGGKNQAPCTLCHIFVLFQNVVNFFLWSIVPPVAILMIAIGGTFILFAGENSANLKTGIDTIKNTFFALIIIFSAWIIINLFFLLIGIDNKWIDLEKNWWKINCPL